MDKKEFLKILRENLKGLNEREINKQIEYYDEYIRSGGGKGLSESDVIEEIGDPRLIAKTILDAGSMSAEYPYYQEKDEEKGNKEKDRFHFQSLFHLKWYHKVCIAFVALLVVIFVFAVLFSIIHFVAYFILPIALIGLVIRLVLNLIRKK